MNTYSPISCTCPVKLCDASENSLIENSTAMAWLTRHRNWRLIFFEKNSIPIQQGFVVSLARKQSDSSRVAHLVRFMICQPNGLESESYSAIPTSPTSRPKLTLPKPGTMSIRGRTHKDGSCDSRNIHSPSLASL